MKVSLIGKWMTMDDKISSQTKNTWIHDKNGEDNETNQTFKEFSEETTLHGLRHVTRKSTKLARIFWAAILLSALVVLVYFLYGILHKITHPQMVTDTTVSFGEKEVPFPSVTICNFNQIRRSYARDNPLIKLFLMEWWGFDDPAMRSLISDGQNITALFPDLVRENSTSWSVNLTGINQTLVRDLFLDGAPTLETMFYDVKFGDTEISTEELSSHFKVALTDMGLCYTFIGHTDDQNRLVRDSGAENGLTMKVYLGTDDYFFSPIFSSEEGIAVLVHMEEDVPSMLTRGIRIEPHAAVGIALSRYQYIYDNDFNDCLNTEASNFVNPLSSASYSREACLRECKSEYIQTKCQCQRLYQEGPAPYCLSREQAACVDLAKYNFSVKEDGRESCDCPTTCNEMVFKETVSNSRYFSSFLNNAYLDYINASDYWTGQYVEWLRGVFADTISVSIFFRELSLVKSKQVPAYTFNDAWGDIGGVFGLCFGASLFTWLEITVFCVAYAFHWFRRGHRRLTTITPAQSAEKDAAKLGSEAKSNNLPAKINGSEFPPGHPRQFLQY